MTELNPEALEAAAKALVAVQQPEVPGEYAWRVQDAGVTTTDLKAWRTNWGTPPRSEKRPHDH